MKRTVLETPNTARGLCEMAHDTVQLAPSHPLGEAIEQLRQAIEEVADAVEQAKTELDRDLDLHKVADGHSWGVPHDK